MVRYRHRQFAGVILASLLVAAAGAACLTFALPAGERWIPFPIAGLFLVLAALFGSLTVEVTGEDLRWSFGVGLIRRSVPLAQIESVEVTETRFIEGWGIHLTSRGWLYNVSGYGAVLVARRDGRRFLLGSDEPDILADALRIGIR